MAPDPIARAQGTLDVDRSARTEAADRRLSECFRRSSDTEPRAAGGLDSEADPIDRYALTA